MSEQLIHQSCETFLTALASRAPVPGGGGAAALAGALGVALCSMVGNFTAGNKKYAGVDSDIRRILCQAEELRNRFMSLVDEDAQAFAPLAQAYKIPRDDPHKAERLETATMGACRAPMSILKACQETVVLLEEMLEKGNPALLSDVGCGAWLCLAALQCAYINVRVNTRTLRDRETANQMEQEMDSLLRLSVSRAQAIAVEVGRRLGKGR